MEKSSFFNSDNGDRKYNAEDWADYFSDFIENGIFLGKDGNLGINPSVSDEMNVFLQSGRAFINGYRYENEAPLRIDLQPADSLKNRIDSIVIQWNLPERSIRAKVRSSELAENPTPVTPARTEEIYELVLAEIFIPKGSRTVSFKNIKDKRTDKNLCGIITSVGQLIDTSAFDKILNEFYQKLETMAGIKNKTIAFPEDGIVTPIDGTALYIGMASTDVNILRDENTNTKITCDVIFVKGSATQLIVNRDYNITNPYFDLSGFTTYDRIIVHFTNGAVTVSKGI